MSIDYSRHGLTESVAPRGALTQTIEVNLPGPGRFELVFDLVAEGVSWFENLGSDPVQAEGARAGPGVGSRLRAQGRAKILRSNSSNGDSQLQRRICNGSAAQRARALAARRRCEIPVQCLTNGREHDDDTTIVFGLHS